MSDKAKSTIRPPLLQVDLRKDGLLWLINRTVFHPRGYALAIDPEADNAFYLMGDGSEPWRYDLGEGGERAHFRAVEAVLARMTALTTGESS